MRLEVRLFASLRDGAGQDRPSLELPRGATVSDLRRRLVELYPQLAAQMPLAAVAVNRAIVPADHPLSSGDEIALLPPVSGG